MIVTLPIEVMKNLTRRKELQDRLDDIIAACRTIVKRLKRNGMRQIVTAQFTNISYAAETLKKRHDYLLTTVRRKMIELEYKLERAIQDVHERYGIVLQSISPTLLPLPSEDGTKTVRVSITLQNSDWSVIDAYIAAGHARSYAGFYRLLVNKWLEDKQYGHL